jgi:hypothetical protein
VIKELLSYWISACTVCYLPQVILSADLKWEGVDKVWRWTELAGSNSTLGASLSWGIKSFVD